MYTDGALDCIDEGIDFELNWTVSTMKELTAEVRRLKASLLEKEDIIHRLNDKLDAALGGEDPWNKVCHQCNNLNCMLRQDCEH